MATPMNITSSGYDNKKVSKKPTETAPIFLRKSK